MRSILLTILVVCVSGLNALAAVPDWSVNPADYSGSMVMVGVINIDGVESIDENDIVAAFIGTEVRGVAHVQYEAAADRYFAYLLVYGNMSGSTLTFKMYDADKDVALNAVITATFQINGSQGNLGSPFFWSNTVQSSESDLIDFTFDEAVSNEIVGTEVNITIPYSVDISLLNATFDISSGATILVEGVAQVSGASVNDFSDPVDYKVVAENGIDFTDYKVNASQTVNPVPTDIGVTFGNTNENNVLDVSIATLAAVDDAEDSHVFSLVSGSGDTHNGSFEISNDQILAKTIFDFESRSVYTIRVKVADSHNQTFEKSVEIVITDVNEEPILTGGAFTIPENSSMGLEVATLMATDPDGDALTYVLDAGDGAFALDANTGVLTVANSTLLDYETTLQFVLSATVSDGTLSSSATVIVNLTDVTESIDNTAPVLADRSFTIPENTTNSFYIGTLQGTDAEKNALSYSILSGNELGGFSLESSSGVLLVSDHTQLDFETNPSFALTVEVSDGELTDTAQITIDLTDVDEPVNQPPTISDQAFTVNEHSVIGFVVGTVSVTDPDGDALTYSLVGTSNVFSLNSTTGELSVLESSALDFETSPQFVLQVTVSDGSLSASATLTITLNDIDESVNQAPQINSQVFSLSENNEVGFEIGTVNAGDPDGDDITYSISDGDGVFSIDANTGVLTTAEIVDYEINSQFILTVAVSDGFLASSATIVINVTDVDETVNSAPILLDRTFTIPENSVNGFYLGTLLGTDEEGDVLSYSILSGNELGGFSLESSSGLLLVSDQTQLDFETNPSFALTVEVSDGELTDTALITIDLTDVDEQVNQAPTILDQTFTADEHSVVGFVVGTVSGSDPDRDALTYSLVGVSSVFSLNSSTGELSVLDPSVLDFETSPQFALQVSISDGSLSATATITINLNDVDESVNQAPQISSQVFSLSENNEIGFAVGTVNAGDPDGDAITYSLLSGDTFSIDANTGALTVTEIVDYEVTSQFILNVEVSDGSLESSATIVVNVTDADESVNSAPVIADETFSLLENSLNGHYLGKLQATDADDDELSYAIISGNELGGFTMEPETGILVVADQDQLDFEVNPTFILNVEVTDGILASTAQLTINLTDVDEQVNQAPTILDQSFSIDENATVGSIVGKLSGSDADGDILIYSLNETSEIFTVNAASGEIIVLDTEALDFETVKVFVLEFNVTDGNLSSSATITVNINDVDENVLAFETPISLEIYPNPVMEKISIQSNDQIEWIECYDLNGNRIFSGADQEIDVRLLKAGTYVLYVHQTQGLEVRKFIKQ